MKYKLDDEDEVSTLLFEDINREIYIFGYIGLDTAAQTIQKIRQYESLGNDNINVIVNSSGGLEAAGWAIYDAFCLSQCKIIGMFYGECMSIATLVMQGCDTRLLSPNCRLMMHNGTIDLGSMQQDKLLKITAKELKLTTDMYHREIANCSNLSLKQVQKLCEKEGYFSAEEALKMGLADKILGQSKRSKKHV